MKIVLILATLVLATSACREVFKNKTVYDSYTYSYRYSRYRTKIDNVTIICSNVYSISEIFYTFSEELYDQILQVTNSNVSTLRSNDFSEFDGIKKLFLSGIHLKEIQAGAFSDLGELRELYLDHNELTGVSAGVFTDLAGLRLLDLSENKIATIARAAFTGLSFLWNLDLHSNALAKLEDDIFEGLSRLSYLNLSGNPLEEVPVKGLSSLDYLGLAGTSVKKVSQDVTVVSLDFAGNKWSSVDFSTLPKASIFNLSDNALSSLTNAEELTSWSLLLKNNNFKVFNNSLKDLKRLDLANNSLERIDATPFQQSHSILIIDLSFNKISIVPEDTFQGLSSLSYLYLQNNNISTLDLKLFKDLGALTVLDLSHNNIASLQFGIFTSLRSLRNLDLSFNKLKKMTSSLFYSLSWLSTLDLAHNNISKFDAEDVSKHLPSLRYISLDGNNWQCEDLIQLHNNMKLVRANITNGESFDVENFQGVPCKSSERVQTSSNFSSQVLLDELSKSIDETIKDSKLEKFLNEDFEQSNFAKFFQKEYNESEANKKEAVSEAAPAALTKSEESDGGSNAVAIMSLLLQLVMCLMMVAMAFFVYKYVRGDAKKGMQSVSQVELSEDY